jgi:hypothetical protein
VDPLRPLLARLSSLWGHPRWPAVRALLVLLHVTAVVVVACPAPARVPDARTWRRPGVRAEVASWTKRLRAVGVDVTEAEVAAFGRETSIAWATERKRWIAPFQFYLNTINAGQGWYMFTAPDRSPQRFALSFTDATGDHRVFDLGRSVDRPDLVDPAWLDEHRVRRAFFQAAWSDRPVFREVCSWFSRELSTHQEGIESVTCSLIEQPVIAPAEAGRAPHPEKTARSLRVGPQGQVLP